MALNVLESIPEFSSLSQAELNKFESRGRHVVFKKSSVLFSEGDEAKSVWFLEEGRIALGRYSKTGELSTTCSLSQGNIFCCLPALDQKPYPATAVTQEKSTVFKIPMAVFHQFLTDHPQVYQKLVVRFCQNWRQVECRLCTRGESAQTRTATVLVELEKKHGRLIPLTRAEISNLAGITIETTIRVMSVFKKQGILGSARRGVIAIDDLDRLKQLQQ